MRQKQKKRLKFWNVFKRYSDQNKNKEERTQICVETRHKMVNVVSGRLAEL